VLVGAQLAGAPLSIVVNAALGRYLGAAALGEVYLAWQLVLFGFQFVDWGHTNVLPAVVARNRERAGELLGASLLWRLGATAAVHLVLGAGCWLLGYKPSFQVVLAIVIVQCLLGTVSGACQDTIRGFERTDVTAWAQIGQSVLAACLVLPTLALGGGLTTVLIAQASATGIVMLAVSRSVRPVGIGRLRTSFATVKELFHEGAPFLLFSIALTLQPNVDVILLSKLAPPETVGWHAAARRLIGFLVMPAGALITALYPTLSRLFVEDREAFAVTTRNAIKGTVLLAVPLALGCAFYRDLGIEIFSKREFGPARGNLLILSIFLLLVYVSMPLGSALLAAGRQRMWAATQLVCVLMSSVLDPLLIPWFQTHYGNGGLGVCTALAASEVLMVTSGVILTPRGVFDRALLRSLARALAAGGAMALAAWALSGLNPFIAAPLSAAVYVGAQWALGGLGAAELQTLRAAVLRRVAR
jgi:O-antigen/teichoic acid export membrane protein